MRKVARRRPITSAIAATAIGIGTLTACSGGGGTTEATVSPTVVADSSIPPRRNVDGRLSIGVWLPTSGRAADLGTPLIAAVDLAVREINEAGGVNGEFVERAVRDEGSDPTAAYRSLRELLEDEQVDVIVGPASSRIALGALETVAEAKVVTCSPTATARGLDDSRRDDGYFVRTIGSEAFEAVALTEAMIRTGRQTFAVLYPEDDYGRAYAVEMDRAFRRLREDVNLIPYDTTQEQFNAPVTEALAQGVEVVAVVGNEAVGASVLAALAANDAGPDQVRTFVSSGLRVDDLSLFIDPGRPAAAAGIEGVSPLARPADPLFDEALASASPGGRHAYAAYAYDCVNLLALAAQAAGTDEPEALQAEITAVSKGGSACRRFGPCAELLAEGRSIDLEGASGDLELQDDGDVGVALYDRFVYDDQGLDQSVETIPVRVEVA